MLISERYSEYGVTGAFFWATQLIAIMSWSSESPLTTWTTWMSEIDPFFAVMPDLLKVSIAGVLGALGIMGIFVTGLILDLMGGIIVAHEMYIFRHQIESNREWLLPFVEQHKNFYRNGL